MLLRISVVTLRVAVLTADLVAFFAALPSEVLLFLVVVFLAVELLEVLLFDVDDFLVLLPRAEDRPADAALLGSLGFLLFLALLFLQFFLFLFLEGLAFFLRFFLGFLRGFGEHFVGALAVEELLVVLQFLRRSGLDVIALARRDGADLAEREEDLGAFDHAGRALLVEERDEGLARAQVEDGVFRLEGGIGAEGLRGGADGLLVLRRIGAQGVLHAVAQLGEDVDGHVARHLGDEVDAHALRADEADDLLDLVDQGLGGAVEEHMRLVEEEHEFRQFEVAHFGEGGVEFGHQPQQVGGVEFRVEHQLVGGQDVHHAAAVLHGEEVVHVERRFAEEFVAAFALDLQHGALDGADAGRGDVAVFGGELRGVLADEVEHQFEVFQVDEQQVVVIGDAEQGVEHAGLDFGELHQARQELRAHGGDGGAHREALFSEDVEEAGGAAGELRVFDAEFRHAFFDEAAESARLADAGKVAFHIGHEAGHARLGEGLGQHLQGHGLTGTRRSRDQAMPVGHLPDHVDVSIVAVRDVKSGCVALFFVSLPKKGVSACPFCLQFSGICLSDRRAEALPLPSLSRWAPPSQAEGGYGLQDIYPRPSGK